MRVAIIEDDDEKRAQLAEFIHSTYVHATIDYARSLHSGVDLALSAAHDIILLDMTMRNYDRTVEDDGGRPHPFAGREILRQMRRARVTTPVIVVTHFDRFGEEAEQLTLSDLTEELSTKFPNFLGTVTYRSNVDEWKREIAELVRAKGVAH